MAKNLHVGESVYVLRRLFGNNDNAPSSFVYAEITRKENRSIFLRKPNGEESAPVSGAKALRRLRVLILRIGDLKTEHNLLDPIKESIHQFCKLLLDDEQLRVYGLRTEQELQMIAHEQGDEASHVVLIGHGRKDAIRFGTNLWMAGNEISGYFGGEGAPVRHFISLCCNTGHSQFARDFSDEYRDATFIAPLGSLDGCIASHFCQTYLSYNLLLGHTDLVSFKKARNNVPNATPFRRWQGGRMYRETKRTTGPNPEVV